MGYQAQVPPEETEREKMERSHWLPVAVDVLMRMGKLAEDDLTHGPAYSVAVGSVGGAAEARPNYADPGVLKEPYGNLKHPGPFNPDVNPAVREQYLEAGDFQTVFDMPPDAFAGLPAWKKMSLKKQKGLF